mmetsp:Transcript_50014/g.152176  ORF Transcript_50014/g.152176 Transcript_50014/m.152176 type:complete len:260 (+) Transcript_50014:763-1542(+)
MDAPNVMVPYECPRCSDCKGVRLPLLRRARLPRGATGERNRPNAVRDLDSFGREHHVLVALSDSPVACDLMLDQLRPCARRPKDGKAKQRQTRGRPRAQNPAGRACLHGARGPARGNLIRLEAEIVWVVAALRLPAIRPVARAIGAPSQVVLIVLGGVVEGPRGVWDVKDDGVLLAHVAEVLLLQGEIAGLHVRIALVNAEPSIAFRLGVPLEECFVHVFQLLCVTVVRPIHVLECLPCDLHGRRKYEKDNRVVVAHEL